MKTNATTRWGWLFLAACFFYQSVNAQRVTHYVNAAGTNPVSPYTTWATAATNIQNAVNAATSSDTVLVTNGIYTTGGYTSPDGTTTSVVVTNAVTLQSVNGFSASQINGGGTMRCVYSRWKLEDGR